MDYKNVINDHGMCFLPNKDFNTVQMQMAFTVGTEHRQGIIHNLLADYVLKANTVYKTEKQLCKANDELYSPNIWFSTSRFGDKKLFYIGGNFVSFDAINDDYSNKLFKYFQNSIFKVDFNNTKIFEVVKKSYLKNIILSLSDPSTIAERLYIGNFINPHRKEAYLFDAKKIIELVDSVTLEELEKEYNTILNSFYRGTIFGNLSNEHFQKFRKYIPFQNNGELIQFNKENNVIEGEMDVKIDNTNESFIYVTYEIGEIDRDLMPIISEIFNSSCGLCYSILREKYGLVYETYMEMMYFNDHLYFFGMIDKKNKQKFLDAVEEIINIAKDKNNLIELLNYAKKKIKDEYEDISESNTAILDHLDNYVCGHYDSYNEENYFEKLDNYNEEDVAAFARSLKRKNIFMGRGR